MKKALLLVVAGVMSLSLLTGCGKSEEEKASDEIAQHLREEAAEDGVDLDEMIQDEMDAYEQGQQEFQDKQASKEEFNAALAEKYDGKLGELKAKYDASTDPEEIEKTAKEYNEVLSEKAQDYYDYFGSHYWVVSREDQYILRKEYLAKMAYVGVFQEYKNDYNIINAYVYNESVIDDNSHVLVEDTTDVVIVLKHEDEYSNCDKMLFIIDGVTTMEMTTNDIDGDPFVIAEINSNEICVNPTTSFIEYCFDYTGDSLEFIRKTDEGEIYRLEDPYNEGVIYFSEDAEFESLIDSLKS